MSRIPSINHRDGFTLVELLVALALTGVIGATIAMTITQLRPMRAFEERIDEQQIAATLTDVVARDLQGALRLPLLEDGANTNLLMRGTESKVTFTAVVPVGYRRSGLREVTYEVERMEGGSRLVRTTRMRRLSRQEERDGAQRDELYAGRLELGFAYLRGDGPGSAVWQQEFMGPNALPQAVRVAIGSAGGPRVTRKVLRFQASNPLP